MITEKAFSLKLIIKLLISREKKQYNFLRFQHKFLMGRDALGFCLDQLNVQHKNVLFPAYTCLEPLIPFLRRNCQIQYYDIKPNLRLNTDYIINEIKKKNIEVFFWINYFGLVMPDIQYIKDKCKDCNLIFIEDNSHALLSQDAGEQGDIVFASLRKVLPLLDGGIYTSNLINTKPSYKNTFFSNVATFAIMIKSLPILKKIPINRTKIKNRIQVSRHDQLQKKYMKISSLSKKILTRIDLEEEFISRRRKYKFWDKLLTDINVKKVIEKLPEDTCPVGYPILIKERDRVVKLLAQQSIYLKVDWEWPEMISDIYTNSYFLAHNSVTLPIHRDITEKKMLKIKNEIIKILGHSWWNEKN